YQKPHPAIWVAALQPATYELAAETGIGVMALSVAAPSYLAPHIKQYKERVRQAKPVGKFINDQWLSSTMALCDWDNKGARELAAKSLRTFFGPDRPYLKDQTHLYEQLVASWGGVPDHLKANFSRYLKTEGAEGAPAVDLSGGSGQIASALWNQIDADTLVERGVLVAGDPESCLRGIAIHEEAGVDELQFLMATETVPHDRVMTSIEMFEALTPYSAPLEGRRPFLRLDFNESTVGPSPRVIEAIRSLPPDAYAAYPEYAGLNAAYAESLGVPERHVEAFNGVDAAIRAIFDAYGEKGSTFLTTAPTFGYNEPCAQQQGMVTDEVPYTDDLKYPLAAVTRKLESRPRLFFVCNPNNPTGTVLPPSTIVALARSAPQTLVVVDELYVAFTGQSVIPQALELENVVALHSLSKAGGIAALRLGFAAGHPTIVERLRRVTGPYDIN